jgi:hypothetical protein
MVQQEFRCNSDNRTSSSTLTHALKDLLSRFSLSLSAFFLFQFINYFILHFCFLFSSFFLIVFENTLQGRILESKKDEVTGKGKVVCA